MLHALWLSAVRVAYADGRPRIPAEWSCRGGSQEAAMRKLRGKVGHMISSSVLPVAIVDGDELSQLFRDFREQDSCRAARWTMELLTVELYLEQLSRLDIGGGGDWIGALGANGDIHFPFDLFFRKSPSFFQTLLWGDGPAWSSIAAGGWSTFALLGRLVNALVKYITHLAKPTAAAEAAAKFNFSLVPGKRKREMHSLLSEVPELLYAAALPLSEVNLSAPWPRRASAAATAEDLLRAWTKRATGLGLPYWLVVTRLLVDAGAQQFWQLVDKVLLPDSVRLCLPQVVIPHPPQILGYEASCQCAAAHCTHFWGIEAAMNAAGKAGIASNHSATAVFRMESQHSLLNNKMRNWCSLKCPPRLVSLFQTVTAFLKTSKEQFTFIDVGSALGDCMVVASFLLPAGRLRGIAFEAHPGMAARAKETLYINRISASAPNTAQVMIKRLALGIGVFRLNGRSTDAGFNANGTVGRRMVVKGSSLDAELARSRHVKFVDLLFVFTNTGEARILRGARQLLQAHRVGCVMVVSDKKEWRPLYHILRMSRYHVVSMDNPHYHVASPVHALELSGGSPCDARFFQWWLRRKCEPTFRHCQACPL